MLNWSKSAVSIIIVILFAVLLSGCSGDNGANSDTNIQAGGLGREILIDHTVISDFESIPDTVVENCKNMFRVFHAHSGYGSQITTGMYMLYQGNTIFQYFYAGLLYVEHADDLGFENDTSWVFVTRMGLDNPLNTMNVVIWSWGDGVSTMSQEGMNTYFRLMNSLELEYPSVTFVYTTGHVDGTGDSGNLRARNNQIRAYCSENKKVLFDVADIESYNPNNVVFADASEACEWCDDWCAQNSCPGCVDCYNSQCLICYRKGQAFWYLLADLSGWEL